MEQRKDPQSSLEVRHRATFGKCRHETQPALDAGHIYYGFRQDVPTDGFGAQTFSRTFRGDFGPWHLPPGGQLSSWDWDYPLGDSYALYPKSWFDFRREKFPAHVVEQFSPVLPDNCRESGFPVAVYRWHAENPATQTVAVSILCSWTNMLGRFRTFSRDFKHARGGS
jgi:non-lysosomal glucosylceramidase